MLRTLSLDAGGVLVRPNWRTAARVFASHGITVSAEALGRQELVVMRGLDRAETIRTTTDEDRAATFLTQVLRGTGAEASDGALRAAVGELCRLHVRENLWDDVPEDVAPALGRLRALGLTLLVLSNANGTVRAMFERVGLAPYFQTIVDSGEETVEKPDPRFFALALERVGAEPATTLHVGDMFHVDVLGARAAGLAAALIDRGDLHADRECPRFPDLGALASALERGEIGA